MACVTCTCVCVHVVNTFLVFQTHKAVDSAVSLLKSDNKLLVSAFVILVCEKIQMNINTNWYIYDEIAHTAWILLRAWLYVHVQHLNDGYRNTAAIQSSIL